MRKYQIVKEVYRDGRVKFNIEYLTLTNVWVKLTERETIEDARYAIDVVRNGEVVSREIVE